VRTDEYARSHFQGLLDIPIPQVYCWSGRGYAGSGRKLQIWKEFLRSEKATDYSKVCISPISTLGKFQVSRRLRTKLKLASSPKDGSEFRAPWQTLGEKLDESSRKKLIDQFPPQWAHVAQDVWIGSGTVSSAGCSAWS
jgi:hypothetical protein